MADFAGKVAVYGIDGTLAIAALLLKTENILRAASMSDSFRRATLEKRGHIIGGASDIHMRAFTFTIRPFDPLNPSLLATAKTKIILPDPHGDVTIDDFDIVMFDGTWTYVGGGSVTPTEDNYLDITLPCEQYKQSDGTFKALKQITAV